MKHDLTTAQRHAARILWANLETSSETARLELDDAPELIRAAIFAASNEFCATQREPV